MKTALLIIDLQNDYFPGYKYPLWNTTDILNRILKLIDKASQKGMETILIQHVADLSLGFAPFFIPETEGVKIRPEILKAAPNATIIQKHYADGFIKTELESVLDKKGINELLVCGMMTQNCVAFTASSKHIVKYQVKIVDDCCTSMNMMIHLIALAALAPTITFIKSDNI